VPRFLLFSGTSVKGEKKREERGKKRVDFAEATVPLPSPFPSPFAPRRGIVSKERERKGEKKKGRRNEEVRYGRLAAAS